MIWYSRHQVLADHLAKLLGQLGLERQAKALPTIDEFFEKHKLYRDDQPPTGHAPDAEEVQTTEEER